MVVLDPTSDGSIPSSYCRRVDMTSRFYCGADIEFDDNIRSLKGKKISLDKQKNADGSKAPQSIVLE
jgi:hypothetical protein